MIRVPMPKGVLVYANGTTEPCEPLGHTIHKPCACCGAERKFVAAGKVAEDRNTLTEAHAAKLEALVRNSPATLADVQARSNAGCVIYIEEKA